MSRISNNDDVFVDDNRTKPHWTDRTATLLDSLAGLGSSISGFFQRPQPPQPQPEPPQPQPEPPIPYVPNVPEKKTGAGTIILISLLGLGLVGTSIYFITKKKN
jgi:hypothetical protein